MPSETIRVGEAKASILNVGDLNFRLRDVERGPESEWRPKHGELFDRVLAFPSQSVHIAVAGASILVDAGDHALFAAADPSYAPKDYDAPPKLVEQLSGMGVEPADVTHVVITHAHYDHYAGVSAEIGGKLSPAFPKARYLLGRGDWDNPDMQKAISDRSSAESKSLGVVRGAGLLELVDREESLTPSVSVVPSPGESPGHQIVRVHTRGETLYCLGDLFHHAVEVEDIRLMSSWCDLETNLKSRRELIRDALKEDATLVAAHMPAGKLKGTADQPRFVPL